MLQLSDAAVRIWLSGVRIGACSARSTAADIIGASCAEKSVGAIRTPSNASWLIATQSCLQHCLSCNRCNYVSISLDRAYCAWYEHCSLDELHLHGAHAAYTGQIKLMDRNVLIK